MMIMLFLLYLIGSAEATPISLDGRQVAVPQASQSAGVGNNTAAIPLSAIIAISTILGVGIIMVAFVSTTHMSRRSELTGQMQYRRWQRKKSLRQAEGIHAASLVSLTAEDLAGTGRSRRSNGTSGTTTNGTGNGNDNGNGRRQRRSRGRALRRTESGRSVKTLPEYSKEAGDEELVLVR
jgi:hypothetical protein